MGKFLFLVKNAIRDSRKNRFKLVMFMSSIVLGIAAIVSINSFNDNLTQDIDRQTGTLVGADIVLEGNRAASEQILNALDSLDGEDASSMQMLSMAYLPDNDESQIVNLKAIDGDFPFYGEIKTEPLESADLFRTGQFAVVDKGMMDQYGLELGDSIKLGKIYYKINGSLTSPFGSNGIASGFAPTIYINQDNIEQTGLVSEGSLIEYAYYKKTDTNFDADEWRANRKEKYREESYRITTIESQKRRMSRAFNFLGSFLNLVALIALLLGCIGVASSIYIYIKAKHNSIAIYRCLGMSSIDCLVMYLIQIFFWGLIAIGIGVFFGSMIQFLLPKVLSEFLPFEVSSSISVPAILEATSIGIVITALFSLLPMVSIRKVSPLRILRANIQQEGGRDGLVVLITSLIVLSIFGFLWILTKDLMLSIVFTLGLIVAYGLLVGVANLTIWGVRKYIPTKWSFVFRQGLSNLYRPNNQTQTLIVSIGLGTAILSSLYIVQGLLLSNVSKMDAGQQPNVIVYGVNPTEKDSLAELTRSMDLSIVQSVPIVTVKLEAWKGRSKSEWLQDTTANIERWVLNRETRVSYRDTLMETEKLLEGKWIGTHDPTRDSVYVSIGDDYAEALNLTIGDQLDWNIQGMRLKTYVGSIRSIDYANMNARFFILFPNGILEQAPQFEVLLSKSPNKTTTNKYRSEVVKSFPSVSVVDLSSILESLNDIISKISYVIKFMAGFSILTGLIVLIASLLLSKFQRVKEAVLLRTIGASSKQILQIFSVEYFLIGLLSALTGMFLSVVISYLISTYQLKLDYNLDWLSLVYVLIVVVGITVAIGLLNNIEVIRKSPLEVLRNELA